MAEGTEKKCEVCQKEARQFCASCKDVFYCSRECQKLAWKKHKLTCRPYSIQTHPVLGRYMIATRDIKAGEMFLKEPPIIAGPKQLSAPLCLGCHKKLSAADKTRKCNKCSYPLCSQTCGDSKLHKEECSILKKALVHVNITDYGSINSSYDCITPLRCLLLRTSDVKKWETFLQLQSHEEDIRNTDLYAKNEKNVVDYLRKGINWTDISPEIFHKICGILTTNSFELFENGNRIRGIYHHASFLAHDCIPNTKHCFDESSNIVFRTTINVAKGSALTTTYSQTLWNTLSRRYQLKTAKFFMCSCNRCKDPTEFGTHLSTLLCSKCGGEVESLDPLSLDSPWVCSRCQHSLLGKQVHWGDQKLYQELVDIGRKSPKDMESFLERYKKSLHPNHRFFIETKYALVKYYGNYPTCPYRELNQKQLESKVGWCRELLTLAEVIDPGLSLLRGTVLLELQAGLVALAKYLISNDLITQEQAGEYMSEAVKHLQEATGILNHEPQMANGGLDDKLSWLSKELEL